MTAKHTPGPWTAEPNGTAEEGFNIEGSRNAYVAFVASEDDNHSVEEAYANARLIAEAPAMRAKLVTLIDVLEHIDSWGAVAIVIQDNLRTLHVGEMLDEARALLARIDGAEEEPVQEPPEPIAPTATNAKRNAQKKPGRS